MPPRIRRSSGKPPDTNTYFRTSSAIQPSTMGARLLLRAITVVASQPVIRLGGGVAGRALDDRTICNGRTRRTLARAI